MYFRRMLTRTTAVFFSLLLAVTSQAQTGTPPAAPQLATQSATPAPWPKDDAGLKELATKLTTEWFTQLASRDEAALTRVMQPSMQVIDYTGAMDRTSAIARIKSLVTQAPKVSDVIATRVADALVVTCLVSAVQTSGGSALPTEPAARLGVWQFVGGDWQLAAWASLSMPTVRPAPGAPSYSGDSAANANGQALLMKFLTAQHTKDVPAFDGMIAEGMQVINFKGQKAKADILQGAKRATTGAPSIADARTTICGDLTIVTCNLSMSQSIGFTKLPSAPAPFMAVFSGSGSTQKVIALANTNKPE